MKKSIHLLFAAFLLCGLIASSGCKKSDATTGTLTLYVTDFYTGLPIVNEQVYLATSYANMQQGIYFATAWTDLNGVAYFGELPPLTLWYDTQHWQNWGAIRIFAGVDQYVFLYVNFQGKKAVK